MATILATIVRVPAVSIAVLGGVGLHLVLMALGLPALRCRMHDITGLPCPACGMSRALLQLCRADLAGALHANPFAPYFALVGLLAAAGLVAGRERRESLADAVARVERRTRLNTAIVVLFFAHGFARLALSAAWGGGWTP